MPGFRPNNDTLNTLSKIYQDFKDRDFTAQEIAERTGKAIKRNSGAVLGSLVQRNIIIRSNGEKRCHTTSRKSGPTRWKFNPLFKDWYDAYLEKENQPS